MQDSTEVRLDKWLWAVRLFKSRSLATEACHGGHVKVNGVPAKPARAVRIGDMIVAVTGELIRSVKVTALLEARVGAKLVPQYLEDLTPPEEYAKRREAELAPIGLRPKGAGRPTKRDRRVIDSFLG
jgi:ribosome-associated heat shock protein Hsp15